MRRLGLECRGAFLLLAVSAGLSVSGTTPISAQPFPIESAGVETPNLWFVELPSPPLAAGGRKQQLDRDKRDFRAAAATAGIQFGERFSYESSWNGLSIEVDPGHAMTLSALPGVKGVYPVIAIESPPPDDGSSAELATALAMTGADFAQDTLGLTGAGVRVAVIDSGINYEHPDLGGCFGPGCRVETGWDFVGEFFTGLNDPVPDDDPNDCQTPDAPVPPGLTFAGGHGTHVTGIVGADAASEEGVTGVAPGVTFGAYRVFGCAGFTFADIILAAMERAFADDMDVINMSLGASFQWPQYPTAAASDALVNAGITVVASIGNSGASGVYSSGAPGVGNKVIGVASVDNTESTAPFFIVDDVEVGYIHMSGSAAPPTSGTEEIVFIGRACVDSEGDTLEADPEGKVALAVRGDCTFREKAMAAIAAGAFAVVVHNNAPGLFSGTVGDPPLSVPVVGISQADGLFIRTLEPVDMTWAEGLTSIPNPTGGLISSFSSFGLSPDLALKPDISAPGGLIRSTFPLSLGTYATLSGTSMASPHVAGAAALLLEARPNTSSQAVRGMLQNSADPFDSFLAPGSGLLENVHRQGAGLLDIPGAIQSTTKVEPSKLSLGAVGVGSPVVHTLTVENSANNPVTYDLSHSPALITAFSTFSPDFFIAPASVALPASVTVPANGSQTVDVQITYPASAPNLQFGGYVVFTSQADGTQYRVPYAGFAGNYQSLVALNPDASEHGNPLLRPDVSFGPNVEVTFNPDVGETATFLVHLSHQVRRLRFELFEAGTGKSWQRAGDFQYLRRNVFADFLAAPPDDDVFAISWGGVIVQGQNVIEVPDGEYVMVISVLKALGDDDNPDHWETWTSPVITVDRS